MEKTIIFHIHTNPIFLDIGPYFPDDKFENKYILISNNIGDIKSERSIQIFKNEDNDITKLIQNINCASVLVIYDLDPIKIGIVNKIKSNIIVIWRFFGYELYSKIPEIVLSKKSLYYRNMDTKIFLQNLISCIKKVFDKIIKNDFEEAIERINYIMCFCFEEYTFLSQYFKLPQFIDFPRTKKISQITNCHKSYSIILGNNRGIYNNHIDILSNLKNNKEKIPNNIKIIMFFNYGPENKYTSAVRDIAKDIPNVEIINDFLSKEEYNRIYMTSSSLIINSYRQMAMNNIITALKNGVKVYLNPKNCIYSWLLREGFCVFDVNTVIEDIVSSNIILSQSDYQMNICAFDNLNKKYTIDNFLTQLNLN